MFVFLHSQHECLNAHNIVSFSAKYAQVTGMWDGVWFFCCCLSWLLFPAHPTLPSSCGQQRLRNSVVENFLLSSWKAEGCFLSLLSL